MSKKILFLVAVVALVTPQSYAIEEDARSSIQSYDESEVCLPFKPALPSNFVLRPLFPDGDIGLPDGIIWSTEENVEDVWRQYRENRDCDITTSTGLIRAQFSFDVCQEEPGILPIDEPQMRAECKKMGAKSVRFTKFEWADYPVVAAEIIYATRKPMALAWMGLNVGPVILIDYIFPDNQTSYEKDWSIWNHFLHETIGIPPEDIMSQFE